MIPKVPSAVVEYIKAMPAIDRVAIVLEFAPVDNDGEHALKWRIDETGVHGPQWDADVFGCGGNVTMLRGCSSTETPRDAVIAAIAVAIKSSERGLAQVDARERGESTDWLHDQYRHGARVARELLAALEVAWPEDAP